MEYEDQASGSTDRLCGNTRKMYTNTLILVCLTAFFKKHEVQKNEKNWLVPN